MTILVTGATGFLGRRVVGALVDRDCEVRVLVRPAAPGPGLPWERSVDVVHADLLSDELGEALDGVDVVVHLAARREGDDQQRFTGTVRATERLVEAMAGTGVRRLVLSSSYSVYDWSAATAVLDERTPIERARLYERDGYAIAKVWQERVVRSAAERSGFELVVLRPGFIWGPGRMDISAAGVPLGPLHLVIAPRARLPLTYVDNCADCVVAAALEPAGAGGAFNVVDGDDVVAWRYAREWLSRERPGVRPVPVPYLAGLALARLASAIARRAFSHGGRLPGLLVPRRYEARFRPLRHSAEAARETLGWTPRVPFEEGLRRSLAQAPV